MSAGYTLLPEESIQDASNCSDEIDVDRVAQAQLAQDHGNKRFRLSVTIGGSLLLLIALATTTVLPYPSIGQSLRGTVESPNEDPYRLEGYLWWQGGLNQTRWVPYSEDHLLDYAAQTDEDLLSMPPPAAALDRAAPPYALWSTVPGLEADDRLAFMRNQHLAFNCDSHCSKIVEGFCFYRKAVGAIYQEVRHTSAVCHLPALNFTLSNLFHLGVVATDEDWSFPDPGQPKPFEHSRRLRDLHMPIVKTYGTPALVIFDSNAWDQLHFWQRGRHLGLSDLVPNRRGGYTWRELQYHRQRVAAMIEALRSTFPGVSIMWKPVHVRALSTTEFGRPPFQGSADIHHINQSLRALMNRLHVPVMELADKVQSTLQYRDWIHLHEKSAANWLAADMALWYLSKL